MKKITTYINSKLIKKIVNELQKIGLDEIKVTEYQVQIEQDTCIEIYCGSIWVNKVKQIFNEVTIDEEWNEKIFFVEDINFNDNESLFNQSK